MTLPLVAAITAVLACLLLGRSAPFLVRRMRPAQAVALLASASLALSLASGLALTAIAAAVIASLAAVAADGHWSAAVIRAEVPIPAWLGALAALAVLVLMIRAAMRTAVIVTALFRAERLCRDFRGGGGPVVVVDDDSADAYTVAGIRGCVVISRRLLRELTWDERQVLTAHELSHLHKRHHLYLHVVDIAAAANPFITPVSAAVRLAVERWADEDAAAGIGDRRTAGRALARVALLRSSLTGTTGSPGPGDVRGIPNLGVGTLQVASRVRALLAPAARPRTGRVVLAVALSLAVLMVGVASLDHIHEAIESATPYVPHLHRR